MSLIYNKKLKVDFTKKEEIILDGQSKICNWLYNQLLDACRKDYLENNNTLELLKGRNLRNYGVSLKKEYPFLNSVFSSVLKEPSARLKRAYEGFFKSGRGYPKFRSWKKKWFSLVFDEPNKGWGLQNDGNSLLISLGNIPDMPVKKGRRNPAVIGKLKEPLQLIEGELLKTLTICKQQGVFYAVFSIEKCSVEELEHKQKMSDYRKICNKIKKENKTLDENMQIPLPTKPVLKEKKVEIPEEVKWISLDPNHKNFFVGVDDIGDSIEFDKLQEIKYWDKKIDKLKSFRDRCQKKYRKRETKHGNKYVVHSPRWNRFNRALDKAYHCRREQIKTALFTIAHELYRHYDLVIIGDYTPTNGTARFKNTKRSMLNQEKIGEFRLVLKWVASKLRKYYIKANEHHTTKECCVCGHLKKKEPNIRIFKCVSCGTRLMRDNNSSVNIAKKVNFLLDIQKYKDKLITFTFKGEYRYGQKVSIIKNKL